MLLFLLIVCPDKDLDEVHKFKSNTMKSFFTNDSDELVEKCNSVDHRCYPVVDEFAEQQRASETLAYLNSFAIKLMRHLRDKYVFQHNTNEHGKEIVMYLLSNYNPDGIIENNPPDTNNTSYVDEKGKVFAICLREKLSGLNKLHSKHDLEFVVLHELTHMATESYGHGRDFWTHFKFLLKEAKEAGLHHAINYKESPMVYCGLSVDYNPVFDETLIDLYSKN